MPIHIFPILVEETTLQLLTFPQLAQSENLPPILFV